MRASAGFTRALIPPAASIHVKSLPSLLTLPHGYQPGSEFQLLAYLGWSRTRPLSVYETIRGTRRAIGKAYLRGSRMIPLKVRKSIQPLQTHKCFAQVGRDALEPEGALTYVLRQHLGRVLLRHSAGLASPFKIAQSYPNSVSPVSTGSEFQLLAYRGRSRTRPPLMIRDPRRYGSQRNPCNTHSASRRSVGTDRKSVV